jgi:hypothetical protein
MSTSQTELRTSFVPSIRRREAGLVSTLVSAVLSYWEQRARGSPPETAHLRRDIGLPPMERDRDWWNVR